MDLEPQDSTSPKPAFLAPEQVMRVVVERGMLGETPAWRVKPEGARSIPRMFASKMEAVTLAKTRFPNAAITYQDATHEYRKDFPMAGVARECEGVRGWVACQRLVGAGKLDEANVQAYIPKPPVQKGPELIVSSFAEASKAKCAKRKPVENMVPYSKPGRTCETKGDSPRCSELTFTEKGPAVRLCPRPWEPGPLVQVKTAQEANDAATKYCKSRVVPKGAPIGWAGDVTLEHPDRAPGEEEIS